MDWKSSAAETEESDECGFVLPFMLQDLCLLQVINDLGHFSIDLLASLPLWLRRRLLNNVPAIDLASLARTNVARDVDIAEIWKPRTINPNVYCDTTRWDRNLCNPFTVGTCRDEDDRSQFILKAADIPNLDPELLKLYKAIPKGIIPDVGISPGCAVVVHDELRDPDSSGDVSLTNVGMSILNSIDPVLDKWSELDPKKYSSMSNHLKMVSNHLLSIRGENLMGGMTGIRKPVEPVVDEEDRQDKRDKKLEAEYQRKLEELQAKYEQWNRQVTPLAKHHDKKGTVFHTPLRYLELRDHEDPIEIFSRITDECGLRPTNVMIDYSKLLVYLNKRGLDIERFSEALEKSMSDVVHLGLWRQDAGCEPDMSETIVKGVVGDGKNCKLKVLYCRKLNEPEHISQTLDPYLCTVPPEPSNPPLYTGLRAVQFTGLDFGAMPYVTAILKQHKLLKVVHIDQVSTWATIQVPVRDIPESIYDLFRTCGELFHREIFQVLRFGIHHTMVKTGNPMMMKDLLLGFMTAPCNHEHQLNLSHDVEYSYRIRDLDTNDMASFEYGEG